MSFVPRFRYTPGTIYPTGPQSNAWIQDWDIEALLVSEPHYKLPNGAWSGGGPFYTRRRTVRHTSKGPLVATRFDVTEVSSPAGCSAGGVPIKPQFSLTKVSGHPTYSSQKADLVPHQATGYARTRPGNPVAGLGQFLVELRDLPRVPFRGIWSIPFRDIPKVLYSKLLTFKNLGDEYLNVVFGWMPFVKDLRDMYNLWKTLDKQMAKLVRENGKAIRRRTTLLDDNSVTQSVEEFSFPFAYVWGAPSNWGSGHSRVTVTSRKTKKVWYVARYKYYIPDTSSSMWNARARLALFGALPTPELLWNVMPWSWLIDWFGNMGDVISNASFNAVDNLVSLGAYTMCHTTEEICACTEVSRPGEHIESPTPPYIVKKWDSVDFSYQSIQYTESKVRIGGTNPFGLDAKLSGLSPYQLSILAALGLSRGLVR